MLHHARVIQMGNLTHVKSVLNLLIGLISDLDSCWVSFANMEHNFGHRNNPSVEEEQVIAAVFPLAYKLLPQQELDERVVQLLHVENATLLLVDV